MIFLFIIYSAIFCRNGINSQQEMRNPCSTKCVLLNECPSAYQLWREFKITPTICYFDSESHKIPYICCPEQKECPLPNVTEYETDLGTRITYGHDANPNDFPFMVALSWDTPFGDYFGCGGTLIHKSFVLTAAHCLYNNGTYRPLKYAIIGGGSIKKGNKAIKIVGVTQHPEYRVKNKQHDIAILSLAEEVGYQTACIASENDSIQPGSLVIAAGYGKTSYYGDISDRLLRANLRIYEQTNCNKLYGQLLESQLCALADPILVANRTLPVHSDTCQGDSGGPLIRATSNNLTSSTLIIGIVSFGFPCGNGLPGVYTKVSSYYEWINSKISPK